MNSECANCGREFEEAETIVATTYVKIYENEFSMDLNLPWQDLLCMDCQNAEKPKPESSEIKITVEGGVIQAISGIPQGGKVTVYDYDTDGSDVDEITRIKTRPDDPTDNEYEDVILSVYRGPANHEDRAIDLKTLKEFMQSTDTLDCYVQMGVRYRKSYTITKHDGSKNEVELLDKSDNSRWKFSSLEKLTLLTGAIRNGLQDNKFFVNGYELGGY